MGNLIPLDAVQLRMPGFTAQRADGSYDMGLSGLARGLYDKCIEAAVALMLYRIQPLGRQTTFTERRQQRLAEGRRHAALSEELIQEEMATPDDASLSREELWRRDKERRERRERELDAQLREEKWESGQIPDQFIHRVAFVHAGAFLYAADMIGKLLLKIATHPFLTDMEKTAIEQVRGKFLAQFPTLKDTRDSVQHYEERVQGMAKPPGKKSAAITPQPVPGGVVFPAGATPFVVSMLEGDTYRTTLADGRLGAVDVTVASLRALRDVVQEALDALPLDGGEQILP
jgi:hypothetical protein